MWPGWLFRCGTDWVFAAKGVALLQAGYRFCRSPRRVRQGNSGFIFGIPTHNKSTKGMVSVQAGYSFVTSQGYETKKHGSS